MRQGGTLIRTFTFWLTETRQRHTQNGVSPLEHAAMRDFAGALRSLRWFACGYVTIRPQDWINVNVVPQRVGS
jgi:type II secretory pathway component PulK